MENLREEGPLSPHDPLQGTIKIVSAYVSNNAVAVTDLPAVIRSVHETVSALGNANADSVVGRQPAVSVKKSITADYLICLEDGKKLKMLKRHLRTHYSMTPEEYRDKWSLPADYPMVAPNYARQRSQLARKIGLGQSGRTDEQEVSRE